jgi:hypothetical protein
MATPMLVLGHQECRVEPYPDARSFFYSYGVDDFTDLDPDGGDISADLNKPLPQLYGRYGSVWNLGTLEHVWDVHTAWSNALAAVDRGGWFVTFSPTFGWKDHAIHITGHKWIKAFLTLNGFVIRMEATRYQRKRSELSMVAAVRERTDIVFEKPQQVYVNGKSQA